MGDLLTYTVYIKHSAQMVYLMLEDHRGESFNVLLNYLALFQ